MEIKGLNKNETRMLTGFIFGYIALQCLLFGGIPLYILLLSIALIAGKEYVRMLEHKGFYPSFKIIVFADILFSILAYFSCQKLLPIVFMSVVIMAFLCVLFKGKQPYIANVATTILGFIYTGWFPLHLLCLRDLTYWQTTTNIWKFNIQSIGIGFVVFLFVVNLLTDTGCYYAGRKFGKHKLAPTISPNKTIEGAIGGIIVAIIGALITGYFIHIKWYHSLIAGFLLTIFAQLGDLSESLIKRDAGVKDSGDILPGHGGFLDRTDGFIFTIPIAYYYFKYFVISNELWVDFIVFFKGLF